MTYVRRVTTGIIGTLLLISSLGGMRAAADTAPDLVFRELQITGNEFVVLENAGTGSIAHLNDYWLGYVSDDAMGATAPPSQQLPDVPLAAGQVVLLAGGSPIETCDASFVVKLSPTLSNASGTLALWQQSASGFTQLSSPQASARWGKSTKTTTLPANEIDLTHETTQYHNPVWYFDVASSSWLLADFSTCTLTTYASSTDTTGTSIVSWPPNDTDPPAIIMNLASDASSTSPAGVPAADLGLKPPQITELLPNPTGTGNDGTDEFIELYNPNSASFDLSGFLLQTGTTTLHSYTFPAGTSLKAQSFTAYYSENTGLSLSNSGGQATLVDPLGTLISQTDVYGSAKDGQSWALAHGTWYWTLTPTPNAANIIQQAASTSSKSSSSSSKTSSSSGTVKGSATGSTGSVAASTASTQDVAQVTPIHPGTLALVVALAVLYGLYEYRQDVANRFYQFRKHREISSSRRK